jgi:hypothetical protein
MSPVVLLMCLGVHCQQIEMPSLVACKREMEKIEKDFNSPNYEMQCIDRRRTEDPNER